MSQCVAAQNQAASRFDGNDSEAEHNYGSLLQRWWMSNLSTKMVNRIKLPF